MQDPVGTRRCALCLQVCGLPIKLCVGCKKRAYCARLSVRPKIGPSLELDNAMRTGASVTNAEKRT